MQGSKGSYNNASSRFVPLTALTPAPSPHDTTTTSPVPARRNSPPHLCTSGPVKGILQLRVRIAHAAQQSFLGSRDFAGGRREAMLESQARVIMRSVWCHRCNIQPVMTMRSLAMVPVVCISLFSMPSFYVCGKQVC